jgi:Baseplate J-like protein
VPLEAPVLDDRRFADLIAEARTLIPRYTPEWTNFNESDPGITLVQLFAWMTELVIYRLNRVPDLNYIKFLQLLGIELTPATAASADLTFTVARPDIEAVVVPKGTQVAAVDGGGSDPLIFETDAAVVALGAPLAAVQVFDAFSFSDETSRNQPGGPAFPPFGPNARPGSALMLGFDAPVRFTSQPIDLAVYVAEPTNLAEGRRCDVSFQGIPLPATVVWEYWGGRFWEPLDLDRDETRALTRTGHVLLRGPGDAAKKAQMGRVSATLFWIRARLERSTYEQAPRVQHIVTNTVRATAAVTARDEVLGGSNGEPRQQFRLIGIPVVVRERSVDVRGADNVAVRVTSVRLEVDEGQGFQAWQEVPDFLASKESDPHFVLNRTTGEITFGDGEHGRIPLANLANRTGNIVARDYRHGGGSRGNVGAGAITELQTTVDFVSAVTNLRAAAGGSQEETVGDAKLRAAGALKSRGRAVTAEDFELLARGTPGALVRRAKALPLVHPRFPDAQIPGVVSIVVVPGSDAPNPSPNPSTLALVCAHLNQARLLTTEVHVIPPTYRKVRIRAELIARADADLAEVKRLAETRLTTFFHPLDGGDPQFAAGTGWEFGRPIFYSELYAVVIGVPGVARVHNNNLFVSLDGEEQPFCRDVPIGLRELLFSEGHQITVTYDVEG